MPGTSSKRGSRGSVGSVGSMSNGEMSIQASVYDAEEDRFREVRDLSLLVDDKYCDWLNFVGYQFSWRGYQFFVEVLSTNSSTMQ